MPVQRVSGSNPGLGADPSAANSNTAAFSRAMLSPVPNASANVPDSTKLSDPANIGASPAAQGTAGLSSLIGQLIPLLNDLLTQLSSGGAGGSPGGAGAPSAAAPSGQSPASSPTGAPPAAAPTGTSGQSPTSGADKPSTPDQGDLPSLISNLIDLLTKVLSQLKSGSGAGGDTTPTGGGAPTHTGAPTGAGAPAGGSDPSSISPNGSSSPAPDAPNTAPGGPSGAPSLQGADQGTITKLTDLLTQVLSQLKSGSGAGGSTGSPGGSGAPTGTPSPTGTDTSSKPTSNPNAPAPTGQTPTPGNAPASRTGNKDDVASLIGDLLPKLKDLMTQLQSGNGAPAASNTPDSTPPATQKSDAPQDQQPVSNPKIVSDAKTLIDHMNDGKTSNQSIAAEAKTLAVNAANAKQPGVEAAAAAVTSLITTGKYDQPGAKQTIETTLQDKVQKDNPVAAVPTSSSTDGA